MSDMVLRLVSSASKDEPRQNPIKQPYSSAGGPVESGPGRLGFSGISALSTTCMESNATGHDTGLLESLLKPIVQKRLVS